MNEQSDDDVPVDDEPALDQIVLRASTSRWAWVLIGSIVFVALGAALALAAGAGIVALITGVLIMAIFVFCAIVAIRQILDPGAIVINRDRLEVIRRSGSQTFRFEDCSRFTTWRNPSRGSVSVVFDHAPDGDTELNRTNRRLMGGSRAITDNYGITPEVLAGLLNHARDAAERRPDDPEAHS